MRFALDSSHEDFASSIDALLAKSDMPTVIRSWASGDTAPGLKVWQRLAEVGVGALLVDEDHDGLGADAVDLVVAMEQLGRHAVPGPLVDTVAVAPALLAAVAPNRLSALASGQLATVAAPPHVPFAVDADVADLVLHVDVSGTVCIGTVADAQRSVDPARRLHTVTAGETLGVTDFGPAFDYGALSTAAQLQGLGRTLLDTTVEYVLQRKQFGRVIGSFQAVKHQLAEVAVGVEMARPLLLGAALAVRDGLPTASRDVSAAKVACGEAAYRAARTALQVHGAIGYTLEHDLSLALTRVRALVTAWGTADAHRARVVSALEAAS